MSNFGQTLFGGSPFIRWALSPFVVIFAIFMPLAIEQWTPIRIAVMADLEVMCLALLAGFWLPTKLGRWAFRLLTGFVFVTYALYLAGELFVSHPRTNLSGNGAEASPVQAIFGFLIIGLPCLWYTLFGRFTFNKPSASESDWEVENSNEDGA